MTESVTDIIVARSRSHEKLKAMIVWSVGLHAAVIAGLMFAPAKKDEAPRLVMSISLSGSEGPKTEGMTQAGAQPVREVAPPPPKPVPVTPPKERPEMTIPDPKARTPPPRARAQTTEAPAPAPTTAPAPTRVRGQGFGMSTSGGRGLGGVQVEAENFCCREYLEDMVAAIRMRWNGQQSVVGSNVMKFTIYRDGTIRDIQIERASGFQVLEIESQHALQATAKLAPLPQAYPNNTLTVHLRFDY
jgi:periplasmic protein TonB